MNDKVERYLQLLQRFNFAESVVVDNSKRILAQIQPTQIGEIGKITCINRCNLIAAKISAKSRRGTKFSQILSHDSVSSKK